MAKPKVPFALNQAAKPAKKTPPTAKPLAPQRIGNPMSNLGMAMSAARKAKGF